MNPNPRLILIGGPNGAGKTTFAREYLANEGACGMLRCCRLSASRDQARRT